MSLRDSECQHGASPTAKEHRLSYEVAFGASNLAIVACWNAEVLSQPASAMQESAHLQPSWAVDSNTERGAASEVREAEIGEGDDLAHPGGVQVLPQAGDSLPSMSALCEAEEVTRSSP